jgi:hypothetical protein
MRLFSGIAGTLNGRQAEEVTQYNCYTTERPKGYINRDCLPFIDSSSIEIHVNVLSVNIRAGNTLHGDDLIR